MPELDDIDMSMLKEEVGLSKNTACIIFVVKNAKFQEEWELMFSYIADFPNVIDRAIGDIERGQTAPHLICAFLSGLVGCFSVYYRHRKILTVRIFKIVIKSIDLHTTTSNRIIESICCPHCMLEWYWCDAFVSFLTRAWHCSTLSRYSTCKRRWTRAKILEKIVFSFSFLLKSFFFSICYFN